MRSSRVMSALVGWVLLGGQGCGGEEFASRAGGGGMVGGGDGGAAGASLAGGASVVGGAPLGSGGNETGGVERESGGNPSGGASSGGVVSHTGGTHTGGAVAGGTFSGGVSSGGFPTGGRPVLTGGAATGGLLSISGGTSSGGVPTGGAPNIIGGKPSGGTATGGAPAGGVGGVVGRGGSGGNACGCAVGLGCCPTTTGTTTCVDLSNDIFNCGKCGQTCTGQHPFCDNGTCGTPPCSGSVDCTSEQVCCNASCCNPGILCCRVASTVVKIDCFQPVNGTCPVGRYDVVCASPDTSIATPDGPRPVASLGEGDRVYSIHRGRVISVPVLRTRRMAVAGHHVVVRATLASGAVLEISAPHPTADGRRFGDLRAGDQLGGIGVAEVEVVPYRYAFTYDILPASDSGTYFAEGALVGSTLREPVELRISVAAP